MKIAVENTSPKRGWRSYTVKCDKSKTSETFEFHMKEEVEFLEKIKSENAPEIEAGLVAVKEELLLKEKIESSHPQGTQEWLVERLGLITASNTPFTVTGEPIPTIKEYTERKACEYFSFNNLGEEMGDRFASKSMNRGNELESVALEAYEIERLTTIERKNLIVTKDVLFGVSLDGYVPSLNMGIEIKCPLLSTYLNHLNTGSQAREYNIQMQSQMMGADLDCVDFVVYYPKMKPSITRVDRDDTIIYNMTRTIKLFTSLFQANMEMLQTNIG